MDSDSYSSHNKATTHPQKHAHQQPSGSELMSSTKFLAEAAKSTFQHETDKETVKVDTGKAAGAAADLLEAASHYGKLEDKSCGNYIEKAEDYLQQYHSSHSSTTTDPGHHSTTTTTDPEHHSTTTTHSSSHSDGDDQSGGGYGEYFKMAQGFLKKN